MGPTITTYARVPKFVRTPERMMLARLAAEELWTDSSCKSLKPPFAGSKVGSAIRMMMFSEDSKNEANFNEELELGLFVRAVWENGNEGRLYVI